MNRRQFTTGLTALAAAPALPIKAMASIPAASAAIPHPARFWAIYMSHLHGKCSPQVLSKISKIDVDVAQGYLNTLISDGVLTPTRMITKATSIQRTAQKEPTRLRERLNKFLNDEQDIAKEHTQLQDNIESDHTKTKTKTKTETETRS